MKAGTPADSWVEFLASGYRSGGESWKGDGEIDALVDEPCPGPVAVPIVMKLLFL